MPPRERRQLLGKLLGVWHLCALHERRDHPKAPLQRVRQLEPDEVARIIEATPPAGICRVDPLVPDNRNHDVALVERLVDHLDEVGPGLDRVDIHEHPPRVRARRERVVEAACIPTGIAPAVVDGRSGVERGLRPRRRLRRPR